MWDWINSTDYMPRRHCVYGEEWIIDWAPAANLTIAISYYVISSAVLWALWRRRREVADLPPLAILLGVSFWAFILACGIGHHIDSLMFDSPRYRLKTIEDLITAGLSGLTALLAFPVLHLLVDVVPSRPRFDGLEASHLRFVSASAHQLKSPPRAIAGLSQMVLQDEEVTLTDDARESLEMIHEEATRMANVVQALHRLSQFHLQPDSMGKPGPIDIGSRLDVLQATFAREHEFEMTWPDDLPRVLGTDVLVHEVLSNLIDNALKYNSSAQKRLEWTWKRGPRDQVDIGLRDNGIGMEPDLIQRKLFGMFERLEPDFAPGDGIGLATCQQIVEHVGGQMWAESEGPGKGSTVWLRLDRAEK